MTDKPDPASLAALPPVTSDEDLATFLRGYEIEAGGALILAMRDGTTTTAQRAAVAQRVLDITHGRPGQARQLTSSDLARMSEEERNELQVALLKLYGDRLPPVLEELFTEMLRLVTGQPEGPLPPAVPRWGDERDEQPGGVLYERRQRRDRLSRALRSRYGLDEPPRPRLRRGDDANGADTGNGADHTELQPEAPAELNGAEHLPIGPKDRCPGDMAPSSMSIRNPANEPHKRDIPSRQDNASPPIPPINEARARPPVPYMIERYNGDRPPRQLVCEVLPTNDMSHALAFSRLSTRQW
jgi:hypothetical protein